MLKWLFNKNKSIENIEEIEKPIPLKYGIVSISAVTNDDTDFRILIIVRRNNGDIKLYKCYDDDDLPNYDSLIGYSPYYTTNIQKAKIFGIYHAQGVIKKMIKKMGYDSETERSIHTVNFIPNKDIFKQQIEKLVEYSLANDIESYNNLLLKILNNDKRRQ